jgi:hypothetical protein
VTSTSPTLLNAHQVALTERHNHGCGARISRRLFAPGRSGPCEIRLSATVITRLAGFRRPIPLMSTPNTLDPLSTPKRTEGKDMPSTSDGDGPTDQPLAGTLIGEDFHTWPDEVRQDFIDNEFNAEVGSRLLSESDRVRVWEIRLQPRQRVAATGTCWITFGPRSTSDRAGNALPTEPRAKLPTYPAKHAILISPEANTSFTTSKMWVTPNWCSQQSNSSTVPILHCRLTESKSPQGWTPTML